MHTVFYTLLNAMNARNAKCECSPSVQCVHTRLEAESAPVKESVKELKESGADSDFKFSCRKASKEPHLNHSHAS